LETSRLHLLEDRLGNFCGVFPKVEPGLPALSADRQAGRTKFERF